MTEPASSADELRALAHKACDGTLTDCDAVQLEELLQGNDEAQEFYLSRIYLDGWLRWEFAHDVPPPTLAPAPAPILGILTTAIHGTVGHFSSGWPVAYLVATVILGIGLLIGALVHVSTPIHIATQPTLPSPSGRGAGGEGSGSGVSSLPSIVGRITGMVDCEWEGRRKDEGGRMKDELPTAGNGLHPSSFIPHPSSPVSLGDEFAMSSGLMEITYDTGAKVILQGPVTYEVESAASGFLSVGKLTARLEKKEERRTKNEELSGSNSSFLIPRSYFAVRTPTAVVTDLGTEFGVEVQPDGSTSTHVLAGVVELSTAKGSKRMLLTAEGTNAAQVDAGSQTITVLPIMSDSPFVRAIPRNVRPVVLFDANFDETAVATTDPISIGPYFTARTLEFDGGRARAILGNPPGVVTLECQADRQSGAVVEMLTRWQHCFRMSEDRPVRLTFSIQSGTGGLQNDEGQPHRKWVGVTTAGASRDIYRPMDPQGFYVTLAINSTHERFGGKEQHPGNIIFVDSEGNKNFLATWDWDTYNGDNAQIVTMTLTSTTYDVTLSDEGIRNLTGSLSGTLRSSIAGRTHVVAYCQGIEGNAGLRLDGIRVERLPHASNKSLSDKAQSEKTQ